MEQKLYQWQEECLERWFSNNGRGMVQAVTGSGKTLLALTAADRLSQRQDLELHVKIVVPTAALMHQWSRALRAFHNEKDTQKHIGLRGGGYKSSPDCNYMIYVINSARYELARQILSELRAGKSVLLIADECHHYVSGQNQLIFEFLPHITPYKDHFFSMGLSATLPSGQAGHELAAVLGRKIYSYGMEAATARRTVCPYDIFHIGLSFEPDERIEYEELSDRMSVLYFTLISSYPILDKLDQKERFELLRSLTGDKDKRIADTARQYLRLSYIRKSLVCMAVERLDCAYDLVQYLGIQDKILIFGERIRQAEALYARLRDLYPGKVARYHSKLGPQANKNALERFRSGDIRILIACKAIDEGVDVPDAAVGIILSGTSTQRQRIQRLGRIIRKKEGKENAILYYLHITESSEDSCFLPNVKGTRIFDLEYQPDTNMFYNSCYVHKASKLLERMQSAGLTKDKIHEAIHCLDLGSVRADWMSEKSSIEQHIQNAKSTRERNYWMCMKKMAEES
ncbi:MAG: DEAD/DEAH box helicase [Lachnospiraceae bacterium]|nr:DEAD/DEAH box helicase [Lachnospiraceae bacterium]